MNQQLSNCRDNETQIDERLLCVYDKKVYDLSQFSKIHPGGKLVVELSKNTDITHLYNSYHWGLTLTQQAKNERFKIREVKGDELKEIINNNKGRYNQLDTSFYTKTDTSIIKLQKHLQKLGYKSKNMKVPWSGVLYYLVGLSMYIYSGYEWYFNTNLSMQYLFGIAFGLLGFLVCGFIQHEGSHNALSNYQFINRLGAYCIMPWGHPDVWMYKHVIEHHPNTNTLMDEDIQLEGSILRHHHLNKLSFFHTFQAWSITFLSIFVSISHPMNFDLWVKYYRTTFLYLACVSTLFGCHFYINHFNFLLTYVPMASFGIIFVFTTQLSHIQEACIDQEKVLTRPPNFTKHQINSCFDYDHDNLFITAFSIFLNFQTYHHLLPSVSHFHFLNKQFIRDVNVFLKDEGIKDIAIDTFINVVLGYFKYMVKLQHDNHIEFHRVENHGTKVEQKLDDQIKFVNEMKKKK